MRHNGWSMCHAVFNLDENVAVCSHVRLLDLNGLTEIGKIYCTNIRDKWQTVCHANLILTIHVGLYLCVITLIAFLKRS